MDALPPLPGPVRRLGDPAAATLDGGVLQIAAGPQTDWFVDPATEQVRLEAPAVLAAPDGDFLLSARVEVAFAGSFDAGALVLWAGERTWAKLAFEVSPQGRPMVVSVVTRGVSDDCNSSPVDDGAVWLRIARIGGALAFHASPDGRRWDFVRHFRLDEPGRLEAGFEAQSPVGDGCTATFSELRFDAATLGDLRSGE